MAGFLGTLLLSMFAGRQGCPFAPRPGTPFGVARTVTLCRAHMRQVPVTVRYS